MGDSLQVAFQAVASPSSPPVLIHQFETLFLLPCLVGATLLIVTLQLFLPPTIRWTRKKFQRKSTYTPIFEDDAASISSASSASGAPEPYMPSQGIWKDVILHVKSIGGWQFAFELVRAANFAALVGLSVYAAVIAHPVRRPNAMMDDGMDILKKGKKHGGKKHRKEKEAVPVEDWGTEEWAEFGVAGFYLSLMIMSLLLLALRPSSKLRSVISLPTYILPIFAWFLYAYRDLYPLATFPLHPADLYHLPGWITWTRIGILTFVAAVLPLCVPRKYVPVDPHNPQEVAHPEQTTPLINLLTFGFLDPLIAEAWKVKTLPYESLPPLTDYDRSSWLGKQNMDKLDPIRRKQKGLKSRHLAWGLLEWLWKPYTFLTAMLLIRSVTDFLPSLALNRLLTYLQTGGKDAYVKPWVWILALFGGTVLSSAAMQFYIAVTTRLMVRAEALLSQLIFNHTLRLKIKDAVKEDPAIPAGVNTPAILIEDTTDVAQGNLAVEALNDQVDPAALSIEVNGDGNGNENGEASSKDPKKKVTIAEQAKKDDKPAEDIDGDMAGKINTLLTADVDNIVEGRDFLMVLLYSPLQIALSVVFLYQILGWSSFVGMAVMVVLLPVPGLLARQMNSIQGKLMVATEGRVGRVTEMINTVRMLKAFGWEDKTKQQVAEKREAELKLSRTRSILNQLVDSANHYMTVLTLIVTFAFYTSPSLQGQRLSPAIVFSAVSVFDILRGQLHMTTWMITAVIQANVSLQRLHKFITESEMIQEFDALDDPTQIHASLRGVSGAKSDEIAIKDAVFTWDKPKDAATASRVFRLEIESLVLPTGKITIVAGETASGKSSFLQALLGEMVFAPRSLASGFQLPRDGGVAYAAQESWVLAGTVKENILFGSRFDKERYEKAIQQCGLETDMTLFAAGDETEIGEKGLTLSGGQKARVALARAVYSSAAIVLLDDILSALDAHTSKAITEQCFKGDLLRGRTVVLVTHHVALVASAASYLVRLGPGGTIQSAGAIADVIAGDEDFKAEIEKDAEKMQEEDTGIAAVKTEDGVAEASKDVAKPDGKLVLAEEMGEGRVSRVALFSYFKALGGPIFWISFPLALVLSEAVQAALPLWLGIWAKQYETPGYVSMPYYLGLYIAFESIQLLIYNVYNLFSVLAGVRASRHIHNDLVDSILSATSRWLDSTPSGRILARFSKDMKVIDGSLRSMLQAVAEITLAIVTRLVYIIIVVPTFSPAIVIIVIAGGIIGELYITAQLGVKRQMSAAKSPLYSYMSAALSGGVPSIRAYGAQSQFQAENDRRIDAYSRPGNAFYLLNRWATLRMDTLGATFAASLAILLTYVYHLDSSIVGFILTTAISIANSILYWVRILNEAEVQAASVERIDHFQQLKREPASTDAGKPPAAWPTSGTIVLEKLSARYSEDSPVVLNELDLEIKSGDRVGIVGRTGSGKSTLAQTLLRLIPTTGRILIDGLDIGNINLHDLRARITIIPQDPVLLQGTLRRNLDPFEEHDDADLYDAMQASGLSATKQGGADGSATPMSLTLDTQIATGGSNLSVGQRQLVALARAFTRKSKVLILDEATASVDFETDSLIQRALNSLKDTTIITVAHRLATVLGGTKIVVLGAGKLLETGTPAELLKNKDGYLRKLVDASGDREMLEDLANGVGKSEA